MTTATEIDFRSELLERREQLRHAQAQVPRALLHDLVADVDAALERVEHGTFGVCDVCHDYIGTAHLTRDPLARSCAEHPSAIETSRLQRDLALARDVQLGLLPKPQQPIDGWQFRYRYEAAGEVGGDFCDVIGIPSRQETLVLVGDVSGKGIAASMLMSGLVGAFRSLSSLELPTAELLTRVSRLFQDSAPRASYATLAAASLLPGGAIDLYNAGHWPPLLRRGRDIEPVVAHAGLPLGLFGPSAYAPTRIELKPDDTLLFYTDGAIDALNVDGEEYSARRLARALARVDGAPLELDALVEHVFTDVRRFQAGRQPEDDLILFAVRSVGTAGRAH
jgi:sigma-B regulation protein RsbU (phosphoserine phosphatase)